VYRRLVLCRGRFQYNNIAPEQEASEKTNALSLRDRQEPGQYYQYQAIPRYVRFCDAYVKSAKGRLCS
jgi:hypothetical protein